MLTRKQKKKGKQPRQLWARYSFMVNIMYNRVFLSFCIVYLCMMPGRWDFELFPLTRNSSWNQTSPHSTGKKQDRQIIAFQKIQICSFHESNQLFWRTIMEACGLKETRTGHPQLDPVAQSSIHHLVKSWRWPCHYPVKNIRLWYCCLSTGMQMKEDAKKLPRAGNKPISLLIASNCFFR